MPLTLYRRKGSPIWYYRGTVGPTGARHRLRGSTRTADKNRAEQIAAAVSDRNWKSAIDGPASVLTFANAAALYLKAGKPPRFVRKLIGHWKDTPIKAINAGAIKQAAITLYPNTSGATRNRQAIVPAMAIINHAAEAELCQRIKVKRFPVDKKEKTPATWTWVQDFQSAASPSLGALACFMFLTGARISEALSLTWADLDFGAMSALITQTKIGSERRAHLPPTLVAAIADIAGPREGRVFRLKAEPLGAWNNTCKRAGIKQLSFHALRHGFATAALQAGIDVITVAKLGGWKTPQHVFQTYGHASDDPTLTDRLVDNFHGSGPRKGLKAVGE